VSESHFFLQAEKKCEVNTCSEGVVRAMARYPPVYPKRFISHRVFWNFVYLVWGVDDSMHVQHTVSNRQFLSNAEWYEYDMFISDRKDLTQQNGMRIEYNLGLEMVKKREHIWGDSTWFDT
jgi:hypothetical protein